MSWTRKFTESKGGRPLEIIEKYFTIFGDRRNHCAFRLGDYEPD